MPGSMRESLVQVPLWEIRRGEWASLMWGFFWRGLVYTVASALAGGLVGGLVGAGIGAVMGASGSSADQIISVTKPIGFVLGMLVALIGLRWYLAWLLGARYGALRLAVLRPDIAERNDAAGAV